MGGRSRREKVGAVCERVRLSFGSLCGSRSYSTVKVDAVHGFPTEESIISLGSQQGGGGGGGKGSWTSGELF